MEDVRRDLAQRIGRSVPVANVMGDVPAYQHQQIAPPTTILDRVNALELNAAQRAEVTEKNLAELYHRLNELERLVRG